jgi:MoaA/NifB/PqqE/SkfB family radical SAM enzyme
MVDNLTSKELFSREVLKHTKPLVYEKVMKFNEKIARDESIAIIQLQYDYACNFRCRHCSISSLRKNDCPRYLSIDTVRMISYAAHNLGLAHFCLSGGEPLLFLELEQIIKAIGPDRFHIQVDTNGWLMTKEKAEWLKSLGVDKIQISIDSLNADAHDDFRRKPGSWNRAMNAMIYAKNAGLCVQIATVASRERVRSGEMESFLDFMQYRDVAVSYIFPKLAGEWAGNESLLLTDEDIQYLKELEKSYNVYNHLTPAYGMDLGCIAVKRMVSITKYGDVLPCIWMYMSLGNIFEEPLENILKRGMQYFGKREEKCLISCDRGFIVHYIAKTQGKPLPVKIEEIL